MALSAFCQRRFLPQIRGAPILVPSHSSGIGSSRRNCQHVLATSNGKSWQITAAGTEHSRSAAAQAATKPATSHHRTNPSSWSQYMASIQDLMSKAQQQIQQHAGLQELDPVLAKQLKASAEHHLDVLMQLAEAEQRHIDGDMQPEHLQQVLQGVQRQLDQEQQEALAALQQQQSQVPNASGSKKGHAGPSNDSSMHQHKHTELSDATAELQAAINQASADLSSKQRELQQVTQKAAAEGDSSWAAAKQQQMLQDAQARIEAAEAAVQNTQQLLRGYDQMCQRAFELSRKLSRTEAENVELKAQLEQAKVDLADTAEELAEHRELQMVYDKQCQDMYKLRMMLQQAQAAGGDVAARAAGTATKYKQDISWLMEAHRREMADEHRKNQELIQNTQELRMRLLELEQQLWGQNSGIPAAAGTTMQEQQQNETTTLQQTVDQLTQDKQQLMNALQDMQREHALLRMELQSLHDDHRRQKGEAGTAQSSASAAPVHESSDGAAEGASG